MYSGGFFDTKGNLKDSDSLLLSCRDRWAKWMEKFLVKREKGLGLW